MNHTTFDQPLECPIPYCHIPSALGIDEKDQTYASETSRHSFGTYASDLIGRKLPYPPSAHECLPYDLLPSPSERRTLPSRFGLFAIGSSPQFIRSQNSYRASEVGARILVRFLHRCVLAVEETPKGGHRRSQYYMENKSYIGIIQFYRSIVYFYLESIPYGECLCPMFLWCLPSYIE